MAPQGSQRISKSILSWYGTHQRDLPWRTTRDPYHIWVSEIMLQQTQVETVIPYYHHFLKQFQTVNALARASLDKVLKAWENMGYYARARNLHAAAQAVVKRFGGKIPDSWDALRSLPGVGDYTAGAILSMAFGLPFPAVDANVRRIVARLFAIEEPLDERRTAQNVARLAAELVPRQGAGQFNQGLMDLGATLCTPKKPTCRACPLQPSCRARARRLEDTLPVAKKRGPIPHHHVTAGIIDDQAGRMLIAQRPNHGLLGGLWKFPGGKQTGKESLKSCLRRETLEELGIRIRVGASITSVKHAYTHFRITLHAFHGTLLTGALQARGCRDWRWTEKGEFQEFAFSKADRKIIQALE